MAQKRGENRAFSLDKEAQEFLRANPNAARALELFGITFEKYQQYIEAQRKPVFYTANTTNTEVPSGELD
jgi:hypothetical protein